MKKTRRRKKKNKIQENGLWNVVQEVLVKHFGLTGYAVGGLLSGLILHIAFALIYRLQNLFPVNDENLAIVPIIMSILDIVSIVLCCLAGLAELIVHLIHNFIRLFKKEQIKTEKEFQKYDSLPGKTAEIAKELAEDIEAIEVEDDDNA